MAFDGDVYLAKSENGFYKIGISKDPRGRIKHFSTIMPLEVEIIHTFASDNCREAEAALHRMHDCCRARGEWFSLSEQDVYFITSITAYFEGQFHFEMSSEDRAISELFRTGRICWTEAELPY